LTPYRVSIAMQLAFYSKAQNIKVKGIWRVAKNAFGKYVFLILTAEYLSSAVNKYYASISPIKKKLRILK
jgi:hypothetical protein